MPPVLKVFGFALSSLIGGTVGVGFYYRPIPEVCADDEDKHKYSNTPIKGQGKAFFSTSRKLCENASQRDGLFFSMSRAFTISAVAVVSKIYLEMFNTVQIRRDIHYNNFIYLVKHREKHVPLLTISNHASTVDDPSLFIALLPFWVNLRPQFMRWSVCTQDICFKNPVVSTFFGLGKVMPIKRGGGIGQPQLLDLGRRLAAGDWVHTYPEGGTVQTGTLVRRAHRPPGTGALKWGTGKLIAHAPVPPVVVPFWHTGMQEVLPEHPVDKRLLSPVPRAGQRVTLRVGRPVHFADLLEAHEREHGPLPRYLPDAAPEEEEEEEGAPRRAPAWWRRPTPAQLALYSAISRRLERALAALEAEARAELGAAGYPGRPAPVARGEFEGAARLPPAVWREV